MARSFPPQGIKIRRRHPIRPTLRRERAISGLSGSKHYPTLLAAARPSIELPRSTSIMALGSAPVQADWAASKGPKHSDRRLWPSGSRAKPWSFFAFFLSTQKEGPRRRGARRDALKITEKCQKETSPKTAYPHFFPQPPATHLTALPKLRYNAILQDRARCPPVPAVGAGW